MVAKEDNEEKEVKTKLQRRKETIGKRSSNGYIPKPDEKVELRGD